jgi:hypothetical protein
MAEGFVGMSARVQAAKQRRDELTQAMERARESRQAAPAQGPARPIERPTLQRTVPASLGRPEPKPSQVQQVDTRPRPPRPSVMPEVTPVAALKNRTALQNQYSEPARKMLYNTPTHMQVGDYWHVQDDAHTEAESNPYVEFRPLGPKYQGMTTEQAVGLHLNPVSAQVNRLTDVAAGNKWTAPYEIYLGGNHDLAPTEEVLAHEFGHKWFDQKIPTWQKAAWAFMGPTYASEQALQHADERMPRFSPKYGTELYAHNAEHGPQNIDPTTRDRFYSGLYRDNISVPPEPSIAAAPQIEPYKPDLASMRERYFSPQQWVRDYQAPMGYYADGSPVRARVSLPSQWETPQWPSLDEYSKYDNAVNGSSFGMRGG